MTIEELKKAKLLCMKAKDKDAVTAYDTLIAKLMLMATDPNHGKEITEADIVNAARKTENELIEEREGFKAAGREDSVLSLDKQIATVHQYVPELMGEEKIREIISTLDDKSVPAVMKHFKMNYAGKVDMKLVNETLRKM